jgi:hypothetical protein
MTTVDRKEVFIMQKLQGKCGGSGIPTNAASILSLISKYHPTTLSGFETKMGYCDLVYNGTTSATDKESANTMRTAIEGMSYDEKQNEITTKQTL